MDKHQAYMLYGNARAGVSGLRPQNMDQLKLHLSIGKGQPFAASDGYQIRTAQVCKFIEPLEDGRWVISLRGFQWATRGVCDDEF